MKALYLVLVFASPLVLWLIPMDWFQQLWLPMYVPFAITFALLAYYRPRSEMFGWIAACPIIFWLAINAFLPSLAANSEGLEGWAENALVIVMVSTPIAVIVSAFCILFAGATFAVFRSRGWLT